MFIPACGNKVFDRIFINLEIIVKSKTKCKLNLQKYWVVEKFLSQFYI